MVCLPSPYRTGWAGGGPAWLKRKKDSISTLLIVLYNQSWLVAARRGQFFDSRGRVSIPRVLSLVQKTRIPLLSRHCRHAMSLFVPPPTPDKMEVRALFEAFDL